MFRETVLFFLVVFSLPLASQSLCGDCDLDGASNALDVLAAAQHDALLVPLTGPALEQCDVDGNGDVTVLDALRIARNAVGLPATFSCVLAPPPPPVDPLLVLEEDFDGANGDPWPSPWVVSGGVEVADLDADRGRLRPTVATYSLARMHAPGSEEDVEVTFAFEFGESTTQGIGFYVRQNGGHLQTTPTHGQGYAVFVEDFRGDAIGIWREIDGHEQEVQVNYLPLGLTSGVRYRVRFRCTQETPFLTRLRAKVWEEGTVEPAGWLVDATDGSPELQNLAGGFAVDAWSVRQPPATLADDLTIDDLRIVRVVNPIAGIAAPTLVSSGHQFLEGPLWLPATGELLFTDIDGDTIYRRDSGGAISPWRSPSNRANGLMLDTAGHLLAAEHESRRVTRTDLATGAVTVVTDDYLGQALNSPNDLAVRSDGTIYFTDPPYGLLPPAMQQLAFNGLFRVTPAGTLVAERMGGLATRPNGVVLSPDERVLYVSDTAAGTVAAFDVAPDGSLSGDRLFAAGAPIADGMCIDRMGNLYVTTSAGVQVYAPEGDLWGTIPTPMHPSNCTLGGTAGRTLFITARSELYEVEVGISGE